MPGITGQPNVTPGGGISQVAADARYVEDNSGAPAIGDFTNATHDHSVPSQGGQLSPALFFQDGATGTGGAIVLANSPALTDPSIGSVRFRGYSSAAGAASTTQYPNDKDCGIHKNTSTGAVHFVFNDGGSTIKSTQLT